jgi:hypothetical protein
LVERLEFDMLFRWFVGLSIDERVFDASTFSKNRRHARGRARVSVVAPRSAGGEGAVERRAFFGRRDFAQGFCVDEELWAEDGSSAPPSPGRDCEADFRKTKRSNATHASTTDKDARLIRKGDGQESRLSYLGYALR